MSRISKCLLFFMLISSISLAQDRFAQIGGQEYKLRKDQLTEPQPPVLPVKKLPGGISAEKPVFRNAPQTKEALYRELDSARAHYAPFLRNLAPIGPTGRRRMAIDSMQWRKESQTDRDDPLSPLNGKGTWESVAIPHYGPPIGHAVTWYTKELVLADSMFEAGSLYACFRGVDYKAEVYFNGVFVGHHEGFFAPFECNILPYARKGRNRLTVKVINEPSTTGSRDGKNSRVVGDKIYAAGGPGFDDPVDGWHLCLPGMGIYQGLYIEARSPVHISDIFVRPLPKDSIAEVWVEVFNATNDPREISLDLSVYGRNFPDTAVARLTYHPGTTIVPGIGDMVKPTDWNRQPLMMDYGRNFLRIPVPMPDFRLWETDSPWLYMLHASLRDKQGAVVDRQGKHFGMRTFTMDTVSVPKGNMYLNGNKIRLRGANSMGFEQNDVMRRNWQQLIDDILLGKLCNMNFFRFTQRPVQDEVYEYCDMLGMLNQTDLPFFGAIRINQLKEAVKQAEEMERLVRSHPSAIMVTYINERFPNAEGTPQRSFSSAEEIFSVFRALDQAVLLSNPDRVIKPGDGDYDPPGPGLPDNHCYNTWYNGHAMDLGKLIRGYWQFVKPGWNYACGEFGAEGLDPAGLMRKYYPASWLPKDPQDDLAWTPARIGSAQTNTMHYMWFPTKRGLDAWVGESQAFQAWALRTIAESFRRDSRNVSCAVHLFIDAWPAGWMKAIMDVDRSPKPAFFAYRNALAPLMTSLRTDRLAYHSGETAETELWVCNDLNRVPPGARIGYEVAVDGRTIVRQMTPADVAVNDPRFQGHIRFTVPKVSARTTAVVRAGIFDRNGLCLHETRQELALYPSPAPVKGKVFLFPNSKLAGRLAGDMSAAITDRLTDADIIIIDSHADYDANRTSVDAFVSGGGKVLFTEIPRGDYAIADTRVEVKKTIMGEYYFANPHEQLIKRYGIRDKDLFMWYDADAGYMQPLLRNVFRAPGWDPVVTTGLCNFGGEDPAGYLAAAVKKHGKGQFIFSEVTLAGRIRENPAAGALLRAMLGW